VGRVVRGSRLVSESVVVEPTQLNELALVGNSRAMQAVYKEIGKVAATPVPVLIRGATGTGKELVARAIHQHSDRCNQPFVAVNCAALPGPMLESELFGHERGAFTGAYQRRIGRFEQASNGTLLLDEVGDLTPDLQVKLLRVLQERTFQRLGGNESIPASARVLTATHRNLEEAIAEREFREDLFFRLSVVTICIPPLAERKEDIPELVRHFLGRHGGELGVDRPSIHPEALHALERQAWPGNVRELENVVRSAMLLARPFSIGPEHVEKAIARASLPVQASEMPHSSYVASLLDRAERGELSDAYWRMVEEMEPELFAQAYRRADGNQAQIARWLGVTRLKLREKLRQFGLHSRD